MQYYIYYLSYSRPGVQAPLSGIEHERLVIKSFDGSIIYSQEAPENGWTHDLLKNVQPVELMDVADAYLGETLIGSTEI